MPDDHPLTPGDLDAWLDDRDAPVPPWLPALDARLRALDQSFDRVSIRPAAPAPAAGTGQRLPIPWDQPTTTGKVRHLVAALTVVALLLGGLALTAHQFGRDANTPIPALVASQHTPTAPPAVDAFTVTPTTCDLPLLTRDRLAALARSATPIPSYAIRDYLASYRAAVRAELAPAVRNDAIVFTGGSPVSAQTASAIEAALGSFLACLNANNAGRGISIYSPTFLQQLDGLDELVDAVESGQVATPEGVPYVIDRLPVTHLRRLADGRVVATLVFPPDPTAGSIGMPTPTPVPPNTVALDGVLYVFVRTDEGWRIDLTFASPSDIRLPLPATPSSG